MSASRIHAILSELHRLLGEYRAPDFVSASEYKGTPPNLKDALRSLARECGPQPRLEGAERPRARQPSETEEWISGRTGRPRF